MAPSKRKGGRSKERERRPEPAKSPQPRRHLLPEAIVNRLDYAAAAIASIGFAFHLFLTQDYFIGSGTDLLSHETPLHAFATSWIARGVLPLWNPYIFSGVPFQAGVHGYLYPVWWLGALLPVGLEIKVGILIHLVAAALGGVWFARGRVKSRVASFVCGVVFALSGFAVMHLYAGHRVMVATASFLPWIAGALDRSCRGGRRNIAVAAFLCGAMILCGHYQVIFIGMSGLALFFVLERMIGDRNGAGLKERSRSAVCGLLIFGAVLTAGLLIAAVQVLPMISTVALSQRSGGDAEFASSFSSSLPNLLTYLSPNLFGNKVDAPFVGAWSFWESNGYLGLLTIQLVLLGFAVLPWQRWLPASIIAVLALALAVGSDTPLFGLYLRYIPGADLFRSPGRFCLLATLFGALMAAESLDAWMNREKTKKKRMAIAAAVLLLPAVSVAGMLALGNTDAAAFGEWISGLVKGGLNKRLEPGVWPKLLLLARADFNKAAIFSCIAAAMLLIGAYRPSSRKVLGAAMALLLFVDLYGFGRRFMNTGPSERFHMPSEVIEAIGNEPGVRFIPPANLKWWNFGAMSDIGSPGGYDTFIDGAYARYLNRSQGRDLDDYFSIERVRIGSPLIRNLGSRFLLTTERLEKGRNRTVSGFSGFELSRSFGGLYLYEDSGAVPRVVLAHRVERIEREESAYLRMEEPGFDMRGSVVIDGGLPPGFDEPEPMPDGAEESARIALYEPNRVEIEVKAASRAVLVLSDAFYPGWKAEVDGKSAPIVRANRIMRAVPVPNGVHRVEMTFAPNSFLVGGAVSCASIVGLVVLIFVFRRRREE